MARPTGALALLTGVGLLYLLTRDSTTIYADGSAEIPLDDAPASPVVLDDGGAGDSWDAPAPDMNSSDPVASFLYAIRCSEHNALDVASGDDYRTFYGGVRFTSTEDHPVATGELVGTPLPPAMCRAAGIASGRCVTTAAGAYQFTLPTWRQFGRGLDFSDAGQDAAARRLLESIGAVSRILAGDVAGAIGLASKRWASLPGSTARQGGRTLAFVLEKFNDAQVAQLDA